MTVVDFCKEHKVAIAAAGAGAVLLAEGVRRNGLKDTLEGPVSFVKETVKDFMEYPVYFLKISLVVVGPPALFFFMRR